MVEPSTPFGKRLQAFRQLRQETHQQIADALGVTRVTYWKWERGEGMPRGDNLYKLAQHHSTTVEAMCGDSEVPLQQQTLALHWQALEKAAPHFTLEILRQLRTCFSAINQEISDARSS